MRKTSILFLTGFAVASLAAAAPEAVLVTYRPQSGNVEKLLRVLAKHSATLARLNLLAAEPHLTFRASDNAGKPILIDLLTWKDDSIPDHAPAEVTAIWSEMQSLVEKRDGRPGIDILNVEAVKP
ncbi:MAG TPA: hypothetical protein VGE98_15100 [Thermoanaerobaculia bacterium]